MFFMAVWPPALSAAPAIADFVPKSGPVGTSIRIEGSGFLSIAEVRFGETPSVFLVESPTRIYATVPLEALSGRISVVSDSGTATTVQSFVVAPRVIEFSPDAGAVGSSVVIRGENLSGSTDVQFAGRAASFSVVAPTQINAVVPVGAESGVISVHSAAGVGRSDTAFVVVGAGPAIIGFTPVRGPEGTSVTIFGRNFVGGVTVSLNAVSVRSFSVVSDQQINVTIPAGATSGSFKVTTANGTATSADTFLVTNAPHISDFSPKQGRTGIQVTLEGAGLDRAQFVRFNGVNSQFSVVSPTQLHAIVPAGATTGPISVGSSAGSAVSDAEFVVTGLPIIENFSPKLGAVGTAVVISGANFLGATGVSFGGVSAREVHVVAPTQINTTVPPGAVSGRVRVTTPSGTGVSSEDFRVVTSAPLIESVMPSEGLAGTQVVIDGVNFGGVTAVRFGGRNASRFNVVGPTQILATVPRGATSGPVSVISPAGTGTSPERFIIAPQVTGFSPMQGPVGTLVTLTGTNFVDTTSVQFSGTPASFEIRNENELVATVPDSSATGTIAVLNQAGIAASTNAFEVLPTPAVVGISRGRGQTVLVEWPSNAGEFRLQTTERLGRNANWVDEPTAPATVNNRKVVTLPIEGVTRFFRLRRQSPGP